MTRVYLSVTESSVGSQSAQVYRCVSMKSLDHSMLPALRYQVYDCASNSAITSYNVQANKRVPCLSLLHVWKTLNVLLGGISTLGKTRSLIC